MQTFLLSQFSDSEELQDISTQLFHRNPCSSPTDLLMAIKKKKTKTQIFLFVIYSPLKYLPISPTAAQVPFKKIKITLKFLVLETARLYDSWLMCRLFFPQGYIFAYQHLFTMSRDVL